MKKSIISVKDVTKHYNEDKKTQNVLDKINLEVTEGEFIILMGKSGSGKSTLLNLISGLLEVSEGDIILNNENLNSLNDDRKSLLRQKFIGFIFQFFNLHSRMTVVENVELPMIISKRFSSRDRRKKAKELISIVKLENKMENYPDELSGGEKQRICIARSLANDPTVILADEPTGNLDSKTAEYIIELFIDINKKFGKAIIIATHDVSLVKTGMRYLKIENGKIIQDKIATDEFIKFLKLSNEIMINVIPTRNKK